MKKKHIGPKILYFDVETAPIIAHVWDLWDQNVGLNQIVNDWHILSWSAKWKHEDKIMYMDQRKARKVSDDKKILKAIRNLLDEADIVVTQNGKKFDEKKLNARFILNGIRKPSSFKHEDTLEIAKRKFAFTSNKLEYMSEKLCVKYKKLKDKDKKFPGHTMWTECMNGNPAAWREMERYNKQDVLALEELYSKLAPWNDRGVNHNLYTADDAEIICSACGGNHFKKNGMKFLASGAYQRYECLDCGHETRSKENLLSKEKRKKLRPQV